MYILVVVKYAKHSMFITVFNPTVIWLWISPIPPWVCNKYSIA